MAEAVIATLTPVQARYRDIRADLPRLDEILRAGAERARRRAAVTLRRVRKAVGLLS